jgi:hypothetical protein
MPYSFTIGPPYDDLQTTRDVSVTDANALPDGTLHASGWSAEVGSNQRWAFVSGAARLPDDSPTVTVSATVQVAWNTFITSYLGWASAEVLVHLWTWGSDFPLQADDRSIHRAMSHVLFSFDPQGATDTVFLRRIVTRPRTQGAWIRAGIWVEVWNGCGGFIAGSNARGDTRVSDIQVEGH